MGRHIGISARFNQAKAGFQQLLLLIQDIERRSCADAELFLRALIGNFGRLDLALRRCDRLFGSNIAVPGLRYARDDLAFGIDRLQARLFTLKARGANPAAQNSALEQWHRTLGEKTNLRIAVIVRGQRYNPHGG